MNRKNRKQICFDVDIDFHSKIKTAAVLSKISMNLLIHRAILQELKRMKLLNESDIKTKGNSVTTIDIM